MSNEKIKTTYNGIPITIDGNMIEENEDILKFDEYDYVIQTFELDCAEGEKIFNFNYSGVLIHNEMQSGSEYMVKFDIGRFPHQVGERCYRAEEDGNYTLLEVEINEPGYVQEIHLLSDDEDEFVINAHDYAVSYARVVGTVEEKEIADVWVESSEEKDGFVRYETERRNEIFKHARKYVEKGMDISIEKGEYSNSGDDVLSLIKMDKEYIAITIVKETWEKLRKHNIYEYIVENHVHYQEREGCNTYIFLKPDVDFLEKDLSLNNSEGIKINVNSKLILPPTQGLVGYRYKWKLNILDHELKDIPSELLRFIIDEIKL